MGVSMPLSFFPGALKMDFQLSELEVGLIFSCYPLAWTISIPMTIIFCEKYGRINALFIGTIITGICIALVSGCKK